MAAAAAVSGGMHEDWMSFRSARHCNAAGETAPRTATRGGGTVYLHAIERGKAVARRDVAGLRTGFE
jgi:hypothetical protein